MKPLLAHVYSPHRVTYPCFVQPKLDGIRALYQNGHFQSRDEQPFPTCLLEHLSKPLQEIFQPDVILDGELYVHGWPLQRINAAVTPVRQEATEDTKLVEYHVFDVIDFTKPFIERRIPIFSSKYTNPVLTTLVQNTAEANDWYSCFVDRSYEGMMYRLGDCPYTVPKQRTDDSSLVYSKSKFLSDQDNRVWHLLKRKDWQDDEFLIIGFNETLGLKGERGFQLHLATASGKPFASGGGLTHAEVDYYLIHDPTGRHAKIKYLVLSSAGIPLGNPTILAIL